MYMEKAAIPRSCSPNPGPRHSSKGECSAQPREEWSVGVRTADPMGVGLESRDAAAEELADPRSLVRCSLKSVVRLRLARAGRIRFVSADKVVGTQTPSGL